MELIIFPGWLNLDTKYSNSCFKFFSRELSFGNWYQNFFVHTLIITLFYINYDIVFNKSNYRGSETNKIS